MSVIEQARMAYGPAAAIIRTPRATEHQVFSQITAQLRRAIGSGNHRDLVDALHANRKLWTTLAVDVADDENDLPRDLRARIFYLAEFTQHHTGKVLRQQADAEVLIDINRAVMAGLSGQEAKA